MNLAIEPRDDVSILIVDDDEDILKMTSFVLTRLGYTVETASDGAMGIEVLKKGTSAPCLILLDLMMPKMDGVTFLQRQSELPNLSGIPVVILSGDSNLRLKATGMNIVGYEQKPISVARLEALVAEHCGKLSVDESTVTN